MIDIAAQLGAIDRKVTRRAGAHGDEIAVRIRRTYTSEMSDVWDALTDPDRMKRWFLPISGDLKVGGHFQLEGNAGGDIIECNPPSQLKVTFGGPTSLLELRLRDGRDSTTLLELEHSVPIEIAQNGAGALFVGPGWDGGIIGLDLYLRHDDTDPRTATASPEIGRGSVAAWITAVNASQTATDAEVEFVAQMALAQFATE